MFILLYFLSAITKSQRYCFFVKVTKQSFKSLILRLYIPKLEVPKSEQTIFREVENNSPSFYNNYNLLGLDIFIDENMR